MLHDREFTKDFGFVHFHETIDYFIPQKTAGNAPQLGAVFAKWTSFHLAYEVDCLQKHVLKYFVLASKIDEALPCLYEL